MAVQYFEETIVTPYVVAYTDERVISKILLGEDIADMFGCVVNFEVGEHIDAFNDLRVFKKDEEEYILTGTSSHLERVFNEEEVFCIPEDLHAAIKILNSEVANYKIIHA